ncbi:MAG TPA: glycoside hydrolase family 130 protein [Saprospiraceae bacterium]|nr:glycoside hydrolase family 130 protein [Saprospiraceae bacterium]
MIHVKRSHHRLLADPRKVLPRFLNMGSPERIEPVAGHVAALSETETHRLLTELRDEFEARHFDLPSLWLEHFHKIARFVPDKLSESQQMLLGAYFTHEYSIQASALFNPSIVPHPDQSGLTEDELRFILSLRAVGEGHISSIAFQTGVADREGNITLDETQPQLTQGRILGKDSDLENGYDLEFPEASPLSSRVLFPVSAAESNGMEDARFVRFNDGERPRYYATYTAYDGRRIRPHWVETEDFRRFSIRPLSGRAASDKGMAIFPEKVNGRYAMIGRQGGRCMSIMYSDDLLHWDEHSLLQAPAQSWEMLQMGNCGSPLKTPQGWLLLTHAVGPMRKYVLSLSLLHLEHPERVLVSLPYPLLQPNADEREGYVPNVLYTCGMILHEGNLIIPYAMSDSAIGFASAPIDEVLRELIR